ncbi:MAG: hypothetical protein CMP91_01950 [Gammaproteobacteria bacterium]|nr:hypothetical protein [Gammaproteobacteria bacterium]|tara:strand:- start:175860 stop:176849 length:990 start_codon:yes stop_codon:yes gene_type:complete
MESLIIRVSRGGRSQPVFHRADHFPFRIGRAYDNDLIIADETVSPHHLEIHADDKGFRIKTLSNENGTWIEKDKLPEGEHELTVPTTINIGRTHLETHAAHSPVEPTVILARTHGISELCSNLFVSIGLIALYLLVNYYFAYTQASIVQDWNEILINQLRNYQQLDFFGYPILLAGIMSGMARIFHHSWRFPLQLSIASIAFLGYIVTDEYRSNISYFFTSDAAANVLIVIFSGIFFAWLLAWQLRAASMIGVKRAAFVGIGVVWSALAIQNIQNVVEQPDFRQQPNMHNIVQRYDIRLMPSEDSVSDFILQVREDLSEGLAEELARDS